MKATYPNAPSWTFPVLIFLSLFDIVCVIAIFMWKRWGFWGFCFSGIVAFCINLVLGLGIAQALFGLIGVGIVYGILQIGKENKAWSQLD